VARQRECLDLKDKVFKLYSILCLFDLDFPRPDYTKDVVDVYTDAAEFIIKLNNLQLLYYTFI